MGELVPIKGEELVLPLSGEIIDLKDPSEVARGLDDVRDLIGRLHDLRRILEVVLQAEAQRQGTKTLHLDGWQATVSGGERVEWDIDLLRDGLTAAGLPQERLSRLIVEEISYKVNAAVAKQVAAANDLYADVVARAKHVEPAPWRVNLKREN